MTGVALAEELLLLAYDDESGKATGSRIGLDLGMAAAVLVELALAGRVAYSDGMIVVTDPAPIGHPVTDEVLARIAAEPANTPASWVQRLRHGLRDRVLAGLCERGIVRDVGEKALGAIPTHRYPSVDASVETDIRQRLAAALTDDKLPDERTAALATLVAATRMEPSLGAAGGVDSEAHQRLSEIAGGAGFSGGIGLESSTVRPSVALVVAELTRAINAALGARS
ncbi:GOLPH3/VPS74 family protein [Micromonospora sonneratiae]|uniref:GPP34 family phosphoprotein n=1 Tax=Micromonospora sonneratiae TaxID=1184706 RepID=A0ABW3YP67_9ACTN